MAWGFTVIVAVALAPTARMPRVQVTVLVPLQLPCVAVAETKVTAGSGSVTVTPVAAAGPRLKALIVYVKFVPRSTGWADALLVTNRSAPVVLLVTTSVTAALC